MWNDISTLPTSSKLNDQNSTETKVKLRSEFLIQEALNAKESQLGQKQPDRVKESLIGLVRSCYVLLGLVVDLYSFITML